MKEQIQILAEECLRYQERQKQYDAMKKEAETLREKLVYILDQNAVLYAKLNKKETIENNELYKSALKSKERIVAKLIETESELLKHKDMNLRLKEKVNSS